MIMAGQKNRKLTAPVLVNLLLEANTIVQLDRQAQALSKKTGFKVYRSDVIREVLRDYLDKQGV